LSTLKLIKSAFDYNHWATERLLASLKTVSDIHYHQAIAVPFHTLHYLLAHYHYYNQKLQQPYVYNNVDYQREKSQTREQLLLAIDHSSQAWVQWLAKQTDLSESTAQELLVLCNHNTHHRSQVFTGMLMLGYQPESLDIYQFLDEIR
jgi:uncharacterized damage-inducible protein DinB